MSGWAGNTSSDCNTTGTSGPVSQTGVVDADVPVTVCDVIVEIDGNSSANCPQESGSVSQQGQLADVYAPVTACGVIAEVYGTANGLCLPDSGFPLVNDLPTNDVSQRAGRRRHSGERVQWRCGRRGGYGEQLVRALARGDHPDGVGSGQCPGDGVRRDGRRLWQFQRHLHRCRLHHHSDRHARLPRERGHGARHGVLRD